LGGERSDGVGSGRDRSGEDRSGVDGSGKNGSVGDGSVRNGLVAKKVAADAPSFNWFLIKFNHDGRSRKIFQTTVSFFDLGEFRTINVVL
jgi:hypothetical protein